MDEAPKKLVEALRTLHGHTPDVPRSMDEGILARARWRLRTRPVVLRWVAAGAVAAGVIAFIANRWVDPSSQRGARSHAARVTILDAFAVARRIESKTPRPEDDVTGDGRVDARDVDHLARLAVALPPRTGGGK